MDNINEEDVVNEPVNEPYRHCPGTACWKDWSGSIAIDMPGTQDGVILHLRHVMKRKVCMCW